MKPSDPQPPPPSSASQPAQRSAQSQHSQRSPLPSAQSGRHLHARHDTRIHFVGIGGIGMSGIAEILLSLGYRVSGSDLKATDSTRRLQSLGGHIGLGHRSENLRLFPADPTDGDGSPASPDVVVVSSAVRPDNPEVVAARAQHIPVIRRAEMLAELMRLKFSLAVAGSHGKTTTSSLLTTVLKRAGLDPTAVIGGKLAELGSNARLGQSDYLVAEADESDGSFLQLLPSVAVITNIDPEHIDHYGSVAALEAAFVDFANKVPFFGRAVLCIDHPVLRRLLPQVHKRYVTYGLSADADYRATDIHTHGLHTRFVAWHGDKSLGPVTVRMPGVHSAINALAVLAVCDFLGVPFAVYQEALADFQGVGRRFTVRGQASLPSAKKTQDSTVDSAAADLSPESVLVIDDYGHHPAEIRATLAAARAGFPSRRILVAFQPHRYTRTRDLFEEFADAFADAAMVCLTDIYAASEPPIPGVHSQSLVQRIRERGHPDARYIGSRQDLPALFAQLARPGDLILTLGAGDISASADEILSALRSR